MTTIDCNTPTKNEAQIRWNEYLHNHAKLDEGDIDAKFCNEAKLYFNSLSNIEKNHFYYSVSQLIDEIKKEVV